MDVGTGTFRSAGDSCSSHDPSHWEAQVVNKTNIDITFSGHTHGMPFGVEITGIRWSPAKYLYTYWAG